MKFIITKNVLKKYPTLRIGAVLVSGIDNKGSNKYIIEKLKDIQNEIKNSGISIENIKLIRGWRDAYKSFGAKPKKHKSSVEALLSRVINGEEIGHINSIVDAYNYISLKYKMPVGGDDISKVDGDIVLKIANGTEEAIVLGIKGVSHPKKGEVVYADEKDILCRRWNWRETEKTQMDEKTTDALIVIESLNKTEPLEEALKDFSEIVKKYLGGEADYFILDSSHPSLDIDKKEVSTETFSTKTIDKKSPVETGKNEKKKSFSYTPKTPYEKSIYDALKKHVKKENIILETPPDEKMGDFAFPCFALSKVMKKSPAEIAKELSEKVERPACILNIKAAGPYLNFYVDWEKEGNNVISEINERKENFGKGKGGLTYIMDVFQANPFKSFHIGHVKNAVFGEAIRRILVFNGHKTITVNYNGDVGTHVAKWLWYFNNFYEGEIPKEKFIHWTGEIYAKACEKADERPEYKEQIAELNRLIDKRDGSIIPLWKKIRDRCYDAYMKIADELGADVQHIYPESECEEPGKKIALELLEKGVLEKSDGAVIANLEKENLGVLVFLKADGTALYAAKDLGLLKLKKQNKFDKLIYIIGSEQDLYLKQLFTVFEKGGLSRKEDNIHVSYGLVTLKEGKMASRLGNVIVYEDLKNEMLKRALDEIETRNPKLKNKERTAEMIAFGAIKFSMLDIDNVKPIKFDWDKALDLQGKTGPYVQYAHARMCSLIKKSKTKGKMNSELLKDEREISLLRHLSKFPASVQDAYNELKPLIIVNHVYSLASKFNEFYQFVPILKSDKETMLARIALVEAARQVLRNGMWILGIDAPEEM